MENTSTGNKINQTNTADLDLFSLRKLVPFLKVCSALMIAFGFAYAVLLLKNNEAAFTLSQERSISVFIVTAMCLELYLMVSSAKSTIKSLTRHSNVEIVAEIDRRYEVDESGE